MRAESISGTMNEKKIIKGLRKPDWTCVRSCEWSSQSPLYNTSSVKLRKIQLRKESKQAKTVWLKQHISKHTSIHRCSWLSIPICRPSGREFQTANSKAVASLKASGGTFSGRLRPIGHVLVLDKKGNNIGQSETCTSLRVFLIWKSYWFEVALPGCTFELSFQMIL